MAILFLFILTKDIDSKSNKSFKLIENSIERLMTLKNSEGGGDSAYSRVLFTKFSVEKINQRAFLGYGIGSFGFEYYNIDIYASPHNIFLEVWFELGFIALLLFIALFYVVFRDVIESKSTWSMALYIYLVLNLLKSGTLIDMRTTIAFFTIFVLLNETNKEKILNGDD
jgi:O-antigen ligase